MAAHIQSTALVMWVSRAVPVLVDGIDGGGGREDRTPLEDASDGCVRRARRKEVTQEGRDVDHPEEGGVCVDEGVVGVRRVQVVDDCLNTLRLVHTHNGSIVTQCRRLCEGLHTLPIVGRRRWFFHRPLFQGTQLALQVAHPSPQDCGECEVDALHELCRGIVRCAIVITADGHTLTSQRALVQHVLDTELRPDLLTCSLRDLSMGSSRPIVNCTHRFEANEASKKFFRVRVAIPKRRGEWWPNSRSYFRRPPSYFDRRGK